MYTVYVKKYATICKICAPLFDKNVCRTFMVCLWTCAESARYGFAALFAKRGAIRQTHRIFTAKSTVIELRRFARRRFTRRRFTRQHTTARPSKCGAHGGRKAVHMVAHFHVLSRHVCCILFHVYRKYPVGKPCNLQEENMNLLRGIEVAVTCMLLGVWGSVWPCNTLAEHYHGFRKDFGKLDSTVYVSQHV